MCFNSFKYYSKDKNITKHERKCTIMKIATNTSKLLRNVPLPDEIATVHDNAVIVDLGSGTTRLGFSGDDAPRLTSRTVVGSAKGNAASGDNSYLRYECFNNAYKRRSELQISNVMERGLIANEDGLRALFHHIDTLLDIGKDTNTPVLITEGALIPRKQRETITQILFEEFRFPSLYFGVSPVMGLYASGRTSGLAIEMGHGTSHTVPIFEGFGLFHSILQMDFGGDDLTSWVGKTIAETNRCSFPPHNERDVWQYIKEVCCPVSTSRDAFEGSSQGIAHTLPDGTIIQLGSERFIPCEALFDPSLIPTFIQRTGASAANATKGIHQLAAESIRKCDQDITSLLCNNIVMTGGGSLFAGLPERFNNEMQDLIPTERVKVWASTERELATFVGSSMLASLPTFQDMWVNGNDYREHGAQVTTRNCF